jgi:hypothetical protein
MDEKQLFMRRREAANAPEDAAHLALGRPPTRPSIWGT